MRSSFLLVALGLLVLAGCTCRPPDDAARDAYFAGNYEEASKALEELEGDEKNRHLFQLDHGMARLALNQPREAILLLRGARDRFLDLTPYNHDSWTNPGKILSEIGASLVDDTVLQYTGRDYEQLMMYSVLTLAELLAGGDDSRAFGFQAQDKLLESIQKYADPDGNNPKKDYRLVALGEYLRAAYLEESPTRIAEATRAYEQFLELQKEYPPGPADRARLQGETRVEPGHGALYLIGFVGQGPYLEEMEIHAPTAVAIAWIQAFWNVYQKEPSIPILAPIKVAKVKTTPGNPAQLVARVDGQSAARMHTVTDVEESAIAEFRSMWHVMVARAYIRRLVKVVASEGAEAVARKVGQESGKSGVADLLGILTKVLFNVSAWAECADLRCWSFLPARVQALRLELPEGVHTIEVQAADAGGNPRGPAQSLSVRVRSGRHSYLFANFPGYQGGIPLLASDPVVVEP